MTNSITTYVFPVVGCDFYTLLIRQKQPFYCFNEYIEDEDLWFLQTKGILHPAASLVNEMLCFKVYSGAHTSCIWNYDDDGGIEATVKELSNREQIWMSHSDINQKLWYPDDLLQFIRRLPLENYNAYMHYLSGEFEDGKK